MRRTDIGKRRLVQALKRGVERGRLFRPPLRVGVGRHEWGKSVKEVLPSTKQRWQHFDWCSEYWWEWKAAMDNHSYCFPPNPHVHFMVNLHNNFAKFMIHWLHFIYFLFLQLRMLMYFREIFTILHAQGCLVRTITELLERTQECALLSANDYIYLHHDQDIRRSDVMAVRTQGQSALFH